MDNEMDAAKVIYEYLRNVPLTFHVGQAKQIIAWLKTAENHFSRLFVYSSERKPTGWWTHELWQHYIRSPRLSQFVLEFDEFGKRVATPPSLLA